MFAFNWYDSPASDISCVAQRIKYTSWRPAELIVHRSINAFRRSKPSSCRVQFADFVAFRSHVVHHVERDDVAESALKQKCEVFSLSFVRQFLHCRTYVARAHEVLSLVCCVSH